MNKSFVFIAILLLLLTSFIPSIENVFAKEVKTIVFPVRIYTLQEIKEIKKEMPVNEAKKLLHKAYEAKEALSILFDKEATLMEKVKANTIIDSFLYEMKGNGLLEDISIKEAKELIIGKYPLKNSIEMKKLNAMTRFFQQNGWEVNAICSVLGTGVVDYYPWNIPFIFLANLLFNGGPILVYLSVIILFLVSIIDAIPHPTTVGYWNLIPYGFYPQHPQIETWGLFGYKKLEGYKLRAITLGFTGCVIVLPWAAVAIGFCPFIAMKKA